MSYYQQDLVFVFVKISRDRYLEEFQGKTVPLDPNHIRSPFPAPFLIQEMRTRGFHRWHTDRLILLPLHPTYTLVDDDDGGRMAGFEAGGRSSLGLGGSGGMVGPARHLQILMFVDAGTPKRGTHTHRVWREGVRFRTNSTNKGEYSSLVRPPFHSYKHARLTPYLGR
jgi:hypothetical protein